MYTPPGLVSIHKSVATPHSESAKHSEEGKGGRGGERGGRGGGKGGERGEGEGDRGGRGERGREVEMEREGGRGKDGTMSMLIYIQTHTAPLLTAG